MALLGKLSQKKLPWHLEGDQLDAAALFQPW
jgi:hypothetical protein